MAASIGSENGDPGFQIAPMVDVVFVLLLFFMACASTQRIEKELSVNLPSPPAGSRPVTLPHIIEVTSGGQIVLNGEALDSADDQSLQALRARLQRLMADFPDDPVILRPADETIQQRVMEVLNACAAEKVQHLTFG